MSWMKDVFDWDEERDPAAVRKALVPWSRLGATDRQLLDALADGVWTHEKALRGFLRWSRLRFFFVTLRLIMAGWIQARPAQSLIDSEYRLGRGVW